MRSSKRDACKSIEGQSTVEFILAMLLMASFSLFFIQVAMVFAWGNYVHYATFMSARAYMAGRMNKDEQAQHAEQVAVRMLKKGSGSQDRLKTVAQGAEPELGNDGYSGDVKGLAVGPHAPFDPNNRTHSWLEGVRYTFRSKLFLLPLGKLSPAVRKTNTVFLTSESWLSREHTYEECVSAMKAGQQYWQNDWLFDNGC